jgi:hypothetical protein
VHKSILEKLAAFKDQTFAQAALELALKKSGVAPKDEYTPNELFSLSGGLIAQGGLVELVGRTIRMQAIMNGAEIKA